MIWLVMVVIATAVGFAAGCLGAAFMEMYYIRRSDNEIYETYFSEDKTKYDVPEWSKE